MNNKRSLAFIVELLGLFILLILVIVIVTQVFVMSRATSLKARQLTEAVMLAENAAEIASVSETVEELEGALCEMENCDGHFAKSHEDPAAGEGTVYAIAYAGKGYTNSGDVAYDVDPEIHRFVIRISRSYPNGYPGDVNSDANTDSGNDAGTYAEDVIEIFEYDSRERDIDQGADPIPDDSVLESSEPIYILHTANYFN